MNGRVYDPLLGRFLSADPNIDGVGDAQGYNRYSYVGNNPLGATDPSGYFSLKDALIIVAVIAISIVTAGAALAAYMGVSFGAAMGTMFGVAGAASMSLGGAIVAGAAGGFASGFAGSLLNGGSLGDAFKAGVTGGVTGAITAGLAYGIGDKFGNVGNDFGNEFGRAVAHGAVGGAVESIRGGQFRNGFYSSFAASAAGSLSSHLGLPPYSHHEFSDVAIRTVFAATVGGTTSVLAGGKFANGATTAAFQHLFNDEAAHREPEISSKDIWRIEKREFDRAFLQGGYFRDLSDGMVGLFNHPLDELEGTLQAIGPLGMEVASVGNIYATATQDISKEYSLFAKGTGFLNNNNILRIGEGWNQALDSNVFRIAWGPKGSWWWGHLDLWKISPK